MLTKEQLHKVALEAGIFIPHKSDFTMSEILLRAWKKGIVSVENLGPLGKFFFHKQIKEMRRKEDCFGILHDPQSSICKSCKSFNLCSVVTHLPLKKDLEVIIKTLETIEKKTPKEIPRTETTPKSQVSETLDSLLEKLRDKKKKGGSL